MPEYRGRRVIRHGTDAVGNIPAGGYPRVDVRGLTGTTEPLTVLSGSVPSDCRTRLAADTFAEVARLLGA